MQITPPLPDDGATTQPAAANSNRTFILLAIPLIVVFLATAGILGYYALGYLPQQRQIKEATNVAIVKTNEAMALANNVTEATPTPPPATALPTRTPQPSATVTVGATANQESPTPVVAATATPVTQKSATPAGGGGGDTTPTPLASATRTRTQPTPTKAGATGATATPLKASPTKAGATATPLKASPTPLAAGLKTATPTQLPGTGFADDAGVPALILAAGALLAAIILARRLRLSLR